MDHNAPRERRFVAVQKVDQYWSRSQTIRGSVCLMKHLDPAGTHLSKNS
jgi:hypothetical protein